MSDGVMVTLAALGVLLACALEVRRADRRHLPARLAATLVALASLVALALEPTIPRRVSNSRAVLVTEGIAPAAARRIADSVGAREVLALGPGVADLAALRRRHPGLIELVIAGWGLSADELARADDLRISFVPAPLPTGLRSVAWPSRVVLGEAVGVRGVAEPGAWLHIDVDGGHADSTRAGVDGTFELRFTPQAVGLRTFALRAAGAVDTGAVDVRLRQPPAVLVLEGTPGFELAHLRRWLARRGGKVGARTTVSRGRARTTALNGAPTPGRTLTPETLRAFDVVVLDGAAARALSPSDVTFLREAVRLDGLGVFFAGTASRVDGLPAPNTRPRAAARAIRIRRSGSTELSPPVTAEPWMPLTDASGSVVLEDNAGGAIAAWNASGAGRVGLSAVRNPSRWLLEGSAAAYDRYWTTILADLERPKAAWRSPPELPAETDRPLSLAWPGRLDTVVVAGAGTVDTLYPTPDPDSLTWSAAWWPRSSGDFRIQGPHDTLHLRAAAPGSWRAARAAERAHATALHAALHHMAPVPADARAAASIPPSIFMMLFTGAAAWLWWERRRLIAGRIAGRPGKEEGRTGVG